MFCLSLGTFGLIITNMNIHELEVMKQKSQWWERKKIGSYFPPVTLESLKPFLKEQGWKTPKHKN